jgi:hypothetical protein
MSAADLYLRRIAAAYTTILATVTRPADTSAYVVGDTIANATSGAAMLTFSNVARKAGGAFFLHRMIWYSSNNPTTKADIDVHLLNDTLGTPPVDNGVWAPSDAESEQWITSVLLPMATYAKTLNGTAGAGGNLVVESDYIGKLLICKAGSTTLYGVPRIASSGGYTPANAETFKFALIGEQVG